MTLPGAYEGWHAVAPPGSKFENRVAAASALGILLYDASRSAPRIRCPLLVCVSDRETLIDTRLVVDVAERAPRGEALHFPADHFQVYFPPLFDEIVGRQVDFLRRHLARRAEPRAA